MTKSEDIEFFGVKIKVKDPRLAALLDGGADDEMAVVRRRPREAAAGAENVSAEEARAEREVQRRVLHTATPVTVRRDEAEDV